MLANLKVDPAKCTRCRKCVSVCNCDVIYWDEDKNEPYGRYPYDCQICCICEAVCPAGALTVVPDWTMKYYPRYLSEQGGKSDGCSV